jgi:hypothetical protein
MGPRAFLEKPGEEWLDEFVYLSRFPLEKVGYKIVDVTIYTKCLRDRIHQITSYGVRTY